MSRTGVLYVVHTINRDKNDFKPSVAEMAIRSSLRDCRPRGLRVRLSPDGPILNGCIEIKSMVYRLQLEQLFLCGFEPRMHPPFMENCDNGIRAAC